MNLTPSEYAEALRLIRFWKQYPFSIRQPDPDAMIRTEWLESRLKDIVHPMPANPPSLFVFAHLGGDDWLLGEGEYLEPVPCALEGMKIIHHCFRIANDPTVDALPPEFFRPDALHPADAVFNLIRTATEFVRVDYGMPFLAREMALCSTKLERDPSIGRQAVRYRGDKRIETTCSSETVLEIVDR
ncbi:hypothetical protein BH09PSE6_BH09PSE6_07170 [soil metagenome]